MDPICAHKVLNVALQFHGRIKPQQSVGVWLQAEEPSQWAWTPARENTQIRTRFEGHWTSGEWLNVCSPVAQIPIRTSTMKHLPIKSNDACDLNRITGKWCIQRHDGHLQMASVQESPHWNKAGKRARNVFIQWYELNPFCSKPLKPVITVCSANHLCRAPREIVLCAV